MEPVFVDHEQVLMDILGKLTREGTEGLDE